MTIDIVVMKAVSAENARYAAEARTQLDTHGVLCLNIMSSPGSGKTALLEATFRHLGNRLRFGVIEGDVYTSLDAERIAGYGVPVVQINTEGSCHMTAHMLKEALTHLDLSAIDVLVVENIGNLICPASFELGEHRRVACLSTPEGPDKVEKYPKLFSISAAHLITKADLAPVLGFDTPAVLAGLSRLNPAAAQFVTSAVTGTGIPEWCDWIIANRSAVAQ